VVLTGAIFLNHQDQVIKKKNNKKMGKTGKQEKGKQEKVENKKTKKCTYQSI
jgi:hypothetical protein